MTTLAATSVPRSDLRLSPAGWAAVAFVLLYLFSVGTAAGQQLDEAAMQWTAAAVTQDGWAEALLTGISAGSVLLVGAALAVVTALVRGLRAAALGASSSVVVLLGAEVLKVTLIRPELSMQALDNSFPSGHVAAVTGLVVALLLTTPPGRWRQIALVTGTPVIVVTGLATVVLQWHRPSDVVGSALLGIVVGVTAHRWESRSLASTSGVPASS